MFLPTLYQFCLQVGIIWFECSSFPPHPTLTFQHIKKLYVRVESWVPDFSFICSFFFLHGNIFKGGIKTQDSPTCVFKWCSPPVLPSLTIGDTHTDALRCWKELGMRNIYGPLIPLLTISWNNLVEHPSIAWKIVVCVQWYIFPIMQQIPVHVYFPE